jgi:hypothetical protein
MYYSTNGQMRGKRADRKGIRLVNVNKGMLCTVYFLLPVAEAEITLTTGKGRWVGFGVGGGGRGDTIKSLVMLPFATFDKRETWSKFVVTM